MEHRGGFIIDRRQDRDTATSFISYSANRIGALFAKRWNVFDCKVGLSARYRYSIYQAPNLYDTQAIVRNDARVSVSTDIEYELYSAWSISASALWSNNESNIESYSYNEHQVMSGISYVF